MKRTSLLFLMLPAVVWLLSPPLSAESNLSFAIQHMTGSLLVPGQSDVPLLAFSATSDNAGSITAVTITYAGDAGSDIAPDSVKLFRDADGDWATAGDRSQIGSAVSFSGAAAVFPGLAVACDSNTVCHFFVTAALSPSATPGDSVSAVVSSSGDISVEEATVNGPFPLNSLSEVPHRITITATRLSISDFKESVTAGETVNVTVRAVDEQGRLDKTWDRSSLSIGGSPLAPPGAAPDGTAPVYSGGGGWTAADEGEKICSFTLYKVETGRQIRFSDTRLGGPYDEGDIGVQAAGDSRIGILPVSNQTAGVPFTVTVYTTDRYGNAGVGYKGSVTAISAGPNITGSPAGYAPAFPAPYAWRGTEPQGQKVFSVVLYDQCQGAQLRVSDSRLDPVMSSGFDVGEGALAHYAVTGPVSVALKTRTTYTLTAGDSWGNSLPKYSGAALVSVSDAQAILPVNTAVAAGTADFSVLFRSWGSHVITVRDAADAAVKGSLSVAVERPPAATSFKLSAPESVDAGKSFTARITACNDVGETVAEYDKTVRLSVDAPATVRPDTVALSNGVWEGSLAVSGETLQTKITISDGQITTVNAGQIIVGVDDYLKSRTYPTVFTPGKGPVKIRYYLREERDVKVRVYNTLMDMVREMRFPAGTPGGRQGLNVIEWDGKGGDNDSIGHSGAYHILIDKGYEKEWTGAVIKNF